MRKLLLLLGFVANFSYTYTQIVPVPVNDNKHGGYVGSLAAQPGDPNTILAAGGYSGLFQSRDAGLTWAHVNSLPAYRLNDVAYCPRDPRVIIVTANSDTRLYQPSGIWRSDNGGSTWTNSTFPPYIIGSTCPENSGATAISWVPNSDSVIVGTYCGLAISPDRGITWNVVSINPRGAPTSQTPDRVCSVLAINGSHFVINTYSGSYYTENAGTSWIPCRGLNPASMWCTHSFAMTPTDRKILWFYSYGSTLEYSLDSGKQWNSFYGAHGGGNMPPFVKAGSADGQIFDLYFGDGTRLYKMRLDSRSTERWTAATIIEQSLQHSDPQYLLFNETDHRAYILCGDMGIEKPNADNENGWHNVGGGVDGLNGLDTHAMGVQSIPVGTSFRTEIYGISWHNDAWFSGDNGLSWSTAPGVAEGKRLELNGPVVSEADARISFNAWDNALPGHGLLLFRRGYELIPALRPIYNPDTTNLFIRYFVKDRVQSMIATVDLRDLYIRPVSSGEWRRIYTIPARPTDGPLIYGMSIAYDASRTPVIYQPYFNLLNQTRLRKLIIGGTLDRPIITDTTPAMANFSKFCTMLDWGKRPVFAADPNNDLHLYAADETERFIKYSNDGGETWVNDTLLTNTVTDFGRVRFLSNFPDRALSQPQAIAFNPFNSLDIYVVTVDNGIIYTRDGGNSWSKIRNSDQYRMLNSISFAKDGWVYFAGHSRGICKYFARRIYNYPFRLFIERKLIYRDPGTGVVIPWDPENCPACVTTLVRKGSIQNIFTTRSGHLSLTVPDENTTAMFYKDDVKETMVDFSEYQDLKSAGNAMIAQFAKAGLVVKGVITEKGSIKAYITGDASSIDIPAFTFFKDEMPDRNKELARKPMPDNSYSYQLPKGFNPTIIIMRDKSNLTGSLLPGETITIIGKGFEPSNTAKAYLSIGITGNLLAANISVNEDGSFTTKIRIPDVAGNQQLEVVQASSRGVLRKTMPVVIANKD